MSIEQHKQIAATFFQHISAGNFQTALAMMNEDATYWILGRRDVIPSAGANDRARMERIFNAMTERMDSPLQMRIKSAIGEGDRVAMEMESHGTLKNGRVYNNQYHLLMRIADGRIAEVREYLDTQHVLATWYS